MGLDRSTKVLRKPSFQWNPNEPLHGLHCHALNHAKLLYCSYLYSFHRRRHLMPNERNKDAKLEIWHDRVYMRDCLHRNISGLRGSHQSSVHPCFGGIAIEENELRLPANGSDYCGRSSDILHICMFPDCVPS